MMIKTLKLLLFFPLTAMAIIDTSGLHTTTPKEGLHGEFKLSLDVKSGNTESEALSLAALFTHHKGRNSDYLILKSDYGSTSGVKSSESAMGHLRRIIYWNSKLDLELFGQLEKNPFNRLKYRALVGAGGRYRLYQNESGTNLIGGLGAFAVQEEIEAGSTDAGVSNLYRANVYLIIRYPINDTTSFNSTTYYQPNLEDTGDYRAIEDASIHVALTQSLALEISYHASFDSTPPVGVQDKDQQLVTTINYSF